MSRRTLITLGIALTVVAFLAAEADFWSDHHHGGYDHFHSNVFTSFRVSHHGDIELDESDRDIVAMTPDAFLEVSERRFFTRRRLQVRPDAAGQPVFEFEVGRRQRSEAEAKEFLSSVMMDVLRSTTIGARPRARRILATEGLDALLDEVAQLDSNAARRIYLQEAAAIEGLTEDQGRRIVRVAGREMTSSSRLRSVLTHLAEELPSDWAVTGDLLRAAERIAASSEKSAALIEIVRLRGLNPDDTAAAAEALGSIAASSEKGRAIVRIARLVPDAEVVEGLLNAAGTIASSSERRRVLDELVSVSGLGNAAYAEAMQVARGIASSSEKASFLVHLASTLPISEDLQQRFLELAATIPSSSEQARALIALLRATDLSAPACAAWIRTAGSLGASSTVASLLAESARDCPSDERVWRAYLSEASRIAASSEQSRALMALLDRDDLSATVIRELRATAQESIASTSERQRVIDRAEALLEVPRSAVSEPEIGMNTPSELPAEAEAEQEPDETEAGEDEEPPSGG